MNEELLQSIEDSYHLHIHRSKMIHNSRKTLAIKIYTNQGNFLLKTLYKSEDRQQFIIEAEQYLSKQGLSIPETMYTQDKMPYLLWRGHPYVVQRWVTGKHYPLVNKERIQKMGGLLGRIHRSSLGFSPSLGNLYSGADLWETNDARKLSFLGTWEQENRNAEDRKTVMIRNFLPFFLQTGQSIYEQVMTHTFFGEWRNLPPEKHFLCHGDFHTFNVKAEGASLHIMDWEDVRFDYPSKDIARLLYVMMRRYQKWDVSKFNLLLHSYLGENPLADHQMEIFYLDLAFPHLFHRFLAKELDKKLSLDQIARFLIREHRKTEYMLGQVRPSCGSHQYL